MKNDKFFKCFSVPLMRFLLDNGLEYELIAIDPSSNKKFWLFMQSESLGSLLNLWKETNPHR